MHKTTRGSLAAFRNGKRGMTFPERLENRRNRPILVEKAILSILPAFIRKGPTAGLLPSRRTRQTGIACQVRRISVKVIWL
jgi:hypothetical protein